MLCKTASQKGDAMKKKIGTRTKAKSHAAIIDIAKRRKGKEPISSSEAKYRTLFATMQQGAFFQDADGRLIDVNPKALQMVGLTRQEFLHRTSYSPFWNLIQEDGSLLPAQEYPSFVALTTGKPVTDKTVGIFNPKTNAYVWIVANAIPLFRPSESTPCQVCVTLHNITEGKQIQEKLELFKESVDSSTDAIGMSTPEGAHFYQNRAFDDLFGDIGPDPFASVYVVKDVGREVFTTIISDKRWLGEVEMYTKGGRVLNILLRAYAVKDRSGRVIGIVGIHTDITQRRKAEAALRKSEEQYRILTETANDAIITVNGQRCIVSWNSGAEKIYGYKPKEIIGQDFVLIIPENQRERYKELFTMMVKKREMLTGSIPIEGLDRRKNGSEFPVELSFALYWVKEEPFFTIITRDISRRKEFEKRLYESEELFRLSFENAPIGITIFDKDGVLTKANMFCETCFGRSSGELIQHGLAMFMDTKDRDNLAQMFGSDHERFRQLTVVENRYFAADGHTIYTKQYIQGIFDTAENLSFIIVLTEDVTVEKQLVLVNTSIINKLKDVHSQLKEFNDFLPDSKKFLSTKSLSDYGLTPMETRIASMIFYGDSNKKIAHQLCSSENTVKHHITSIYSKFKVKNRIAFLNTIRTNKIII